MVPLVPDIYIDTSLQTTWLNAQYFISKINLHFIIYMISILPNNAKRMNVPQSNVIYMYMCKLYKYIAVHIIIYTHTYIYIPCLCRMVLALRISKRCKPKEQTKINLDKDA